MSPHPTLEDLLARDDPETRLENIHAAHDLPRRMALPVLREAHDDPRSRVSAGAVEAIGARRIEEAVPALVSGLTREHRSLAAAEATPNVERVLALQHDNTTRRVLWEVQAEDFEACKAGELTLEAFEDRIEATRYGEDGQPTGSGG